MAPGVRINVMAKPAIRHRPKTHPRAGGKAVLLRLFIAGMSARSVSAIDSIKRICKEHLDGDYELEIVDLYRQPHRAKKHDIIAAPTLVKEKPRPVRRVIGSLSDEERVMMGLNVKKK
jgi:circadian clock protein KaiB